MFDAGNPVSIFVPLLVVVALTFLAFCRMEMARGAAMQGGQDPNYYKAYVGTPEPEATVAAVRHWNNLFEAPTLFFAGCLALFAIKAVTGWSLGFAWGFAASRVIQSAIHMTYNHPIQRGVAFLFGVLFIFAIWGAVAIAVFARL